MKVVRYAARVLWFSLGRLVRLRPVLSLKQCCELDFWRREIRRYVEWYEARLPDLYGIPAPTPEKKVTGYHLSENAIRTWAGACTKWYPDQLAIPTGYFRGKRILDVGSGPIPHALAFEDCEVYGVDPLIEEYERLGFPVAGFSERFVGVAAPAERMPFPDAFFDAVVSVNAIDHVDDFPAVAREVSRVLRPGGIVRFVAHYHEPRVCEPNCLSDEVVLKHFGPLGVRKVSERPFTEFHPECPDRGERLVVWSNAD